MRAADLKRLGCCALVALSTATSAVERAPSSERSGPQSWSYTIRASDLATGILSIELALHGFSSPLRLCADMRDAAPSVRGLARASDDPDCFEVAAPAAGPFVVNYQVDLHDLSHRHGDPDWAARAGDDYVFNDESVLLRPDPMPDDAAIDITFDVRDGVGIAAPWKQLDQAGRHFQSSSRQYDAGSYVALGHLQRLPSLDAQGCSFEVVLLGGAHRASTKALQSWVARAGRAVAEFYRGVPTGHALVVLLPVAGASEGGVFGSTLHRAAPSSVLFFGADAADAQFEHDWMATHELFHIGNPRLATRVHWFNEGSATYYQDVLRARAGQERASAIWSDLYDGFRRFCEPAGTPPMSLADESEGLRKLHHYTRVYWGGACLLFRADVAIRERSEGRTGLDDVLRELLKRSQARPLEESELIDAIDEAAGTPLVRAGLESTVAVPMDALYRKLGIEPVAEARVNLNERATEAALRIAILAAPVVDSTKSRRSSSETRR